ncbi:CopG domain protein DNA-binding domain protein [Lysobacter dokdonensis DS-58]|uniref:CopG domain protein DNA-binding domain protein n=1 Tax=Lysobacter dokdonensis DS-58 TaxID=1300345 RepID=A0A0A2WEK8_9GAMM|nr:colicin immunity domain-containing protein [Lysobacter dokdonensis]KGQ18163.1 CopG domain protein DNA-binding domain protein [Lysobacter dokdonensis DS-58]
MNLQERLKLTNHLLTAVTWAALFALSLHLVVVKVALASKPDLVYLIAPVILLLVVIRSTRRYFHYRKLMQRGRVAKYLDLMRAFLGCAITANQFQASYLQTFKADDSKFSAMEYEILNRVFCDADCYTTDVQLRAEKPEILIDEAELRRNVAVALGDLCALENAPQRA